MLNKISLKIGAVFASIVIVYILFITFIISPKITNYLIEIETKQAITQLNRVETIFKEKENYLIQLQKEHTSEYKKEVKQTVEIAYSIMDRFYNMYKEGKITKKEALTNTYNLFSKIEYGHDGDYLYVLDTKGNLDYHPDKRFNKKNIYNIPDANGKLFVPKLITNTLKNKSAYTTYSWTKLNSNFVSEKIVYSIYFEPLNLIINAGVYLEDIEQELISQKTKIEFELTPLIQNIEKEHMGFIYIVNYDAKVVLHPDERFVNIDLSLIEEPNSKVSMMESLLNSYNKNKVWKYKWNRSDDLENFSYEKIAWIKNNPFFDWYIISAIYKNDLDKKSKEINEMVLNLSLGILLVLTIIAFVFVRRLLHPITVLSQNADLVKQGRLEIRNKISSNDELGALSTHFNSMMDYIENNTKNLEEVIKQRTQELEYKFYHDELTNLKNRLYLNKDLKDVEFYALSIIDINGFDEINELYGYETGDKVILKATKTLQDFAEEHNVSLYKLNYDVFAILDRNIPKFVSYEKFLDLIQKEFDKEFYIEELGFQLHLYVSIGTSLSQEDAIRTANIALKKAKKTGAKYIAYSKAIDSKENIKNHMYWRDRVKNAIKNDNIVPFYQPIFNQDKKIVKYETLMRIYEPENDSYFSPGVFLDIAMKTGQYFKLNQVIIQKAFKDVSSIDADVSINISFTEIFNLNFERFLSSQIDRLNKKDRKKIVFEILEADFVADYSALEKFILKYRQKGIRIAIDDFGTGYSNFAHILKIKPDYLKIDGSLIEGIVDDGNSYEIVKSIVDFSKLLEMKVIAEYVVCEKTFELLKDLGVDEYQGFYLGEPKLLI